MSSPSSIDYANQRAIEALDQKIERLTRLVEELLKEIIGDE